MLSLSAVQVLYSQRRRSIRLNPLAKWCLSFFFNECRIIYQHVVPSTSQRQKQTVNSEYYWEFWKCCSHILLKKKKGLKWRRNAPSSMITHILILLIRWQCFSQEMGSGSQSIPLTALISHRAWNSHFGDRDSSLMKQLLQRWIPAPILSIRASLPKHGWSGGRDGTNVLRHVVVILKKSL